jgi:hypothetical protein
VFDGGYERTPIYSYFWYPAIFGAAGLGGNVFKNVLYRRPLNTGLHVTVFGGVTGWLFGCWLRNRLATKNANEIAAVKHYLMLHPEKFPEPEKKKFGEKEVFLEWPINR